jgi:hypothetical protein
MVQGDIQGVIDIINDNRNSVLNVKNGQEVAIQSQHGKLAARGTT